MVKKYAIFLVSQLVCSVTLQAVTISIKNGTKTPINVALYKPLEKKTATVDTEETAPEWELGKDNVAPGKKITISKGLGVGTYEMDAYNTHGNQHTTSRKLKIAITNDRDVISVIVHPHEIRYTFQ